MSSERQGTPIYVCSYCGRFGPMADLQGECTPGLTHGLVKVVPPMTERDAVQALKADVKQLRAALNEYADHQSWRCAHPDRYPWEPDCPCGLVAAMEKVGIRISPGSRGTP